MATWRLLGSNRKDIIFKLIIESTTLCAISFIIGFIFAFVFKPYANSILDTKINIIKAFTPLNCAITIAIILLLGCTAGILPAIIISASKPIDVVRGTFRRKTKMFFSKVFITFQNTITIIMIAASLTMFLQIPHLIHAPLNYETSNIIDLQAYKIKNIDPFINEIKELPFVKEVSKCMGTPWNGGNNYTNIIDGKTVSLQLLYGDQNFMKTYGITLEKDNKLDKENGVYVNNKLSAELGLSKDTESYNFFNKGNVGIRGIVKDFHLRDIESKQNPLIIFYL